MNTISNRSDDMGQNVEFMAKKIVVNLEYEIIRKYCHCIPYILKSNIWYWNDQSNYRLVNLWKFLPNMEQIATEMVLCFSGSEFIHLQHIKSILQNIWWKRVKSKMASKMAAIYEYHDISASKIGSSMILKLFSTFW